VQERAPRLVLRFTLVTVACLGLGAAAILGFVRHTDTKQAERAAATRAQLAVDGLFLGALEPGDLNGTMPAARRHALGAALEPLLLSDGALVTASHRGRIFWSTDPARIGRPDAAPVVASARHATLRSEVTSLGGQRFLRSVVPVRFNGAALAVAVYQDYAPISRQAHDAFLPVAGVLELILFALFVLLVPLLARVSRRIARQVERIRFQALHDDLTGLPNRVRFRAGVAEAAELAAAGELTFALLLIDVDRFKEVNDALGHGVGDDLLVEMGERIQKSAPEGALVARLGGDEFGVVIPDTDEQEATAAADWLRAAIAKPATVGGLPVAVEASVGVVLCPGDGDDVDTLMRRADMAMYGAKERRLGTACYQPEFDTSTPERVALMADLGRALDEGELVLWYQPQAGLQRGDIVGAEALVRWNHPTRGLLPPGEFVPFAERTGLGRRLSRYVLEAAVRQLACWRDDSDAPPRVAVNLSMVDLLDLGLPDEVERLVAEAEIPADRLELEITESVIMADPVRVGAVLERLREVGVALAIDDFGTGYSSLAYLKNLPVDVLKIDRSFISAMASEDRDRAVVHSAVELAHSLGLGVVAEGVEDEATYETLRRIGCDYVQGFYISRPVPPEDITAVNAAWVSGVPLATS
jgi:diguanylate cyclase